MLTIKPFSAYVVPGDVAQFRCGELDIHVIVQHDSDTSPTDSDCYTSEQLAAFEAGEAEFVGLVATVEFRGVEFSPAASLWGIDNFRDSASASYITDEAKELALEAIRNLYSMLGDLGTALVTTESQLAKHLQAVPTLAP